jgi:rhomboid protease GluP
MPEARARPWLTYAVIAANVVMFGVEIAGGASPIAPTPQQIIDLGGSYPPLTLNGEWWRLGSSMFLHFGIIHIALNMVCLYQARVVEQLFDHVGFVVIYLLAGLGGGIASLVVGAEHAVSAGASGAVFGVYGAFGAFLVMRRAQIQEDAWRRTARSLGRFLVLNLVVGLSVSSISLSAHVGGVIIGFGVGAALLAGARAPRQRTPRALGLLGLGLALTAVAVLSLRAAPDLTPVLTRFDSVDHASVTRWNAAITAAKENTIQEPELAEILEREVIAPYQQMRQELLATRDIPERLRPLMQRLDGFTAARLAAWQQLDASLRQPDKDKREAMLAVYQVKEADLRERKAAYEAEVRRLGE